MKSHFGECSLKVLKSNSPNQVGNSQESNQTFRYVVRDKELCTVASSRRTIKQSTTDKTTRRREIACLNVHFPGGNASAVQAIETASESAMSNPARGDYQFVVAPATFPLPVPLHNRSL